MTYSETHSKDSASRQTAVQHMNLVVKILMLLLDTEVITRIATLWKLIREGFWARSHEGMYEVLQYDSVLELQDTEGKRAVFHKYQQVQFKQNNIIAFQDQAWGEGNIFAEYSCTPGVPVDTYKEGHRYLILISLRGVKNRGDVTEFHIERTITDGFLEPVEQFQNDINHIMHNFSCSVIFPAKRPPTSVVLIEQNIRRSTTLTPKHFATLPDGRVRVRWETPKPRLYESYILQWHW